MEAVTPQRLGREEGRVLGVCHTPSLLYSPASLSPALSRVQDSSSSQPTLSNTALCTASLQLLALPTVSEGQLPPRALPSL